MPGPRSSIGNLGRVYRGLVALRIIFAFLGTGYIHPDEYFQNGEITAGQVLNWHNLRTWEWDPASPCRSIVPPFLTTGLPLLVVKKVLPAISSNTVFWIQRFSSLLISFLLDFSVAQAVPAARHKALVLLASSHVLLTFQVRPFSNSLEAALVAISLAMLYRMNCLADRNGLHKSPFSTDATWLALVLVLGAMTRITFLAFVLPIMLSTGLHSVRLASRDGRFSASRWVKIILTPLCVAIVGLISIVAIDTVYFRGNLEQLVVTPYNNLLYNLLPENLAEHGLHPRWLHLAVNLPMIVGPGLVFYGILAAKRVMHQTKDRQSSQIIISRTCVFIIAVSMAVLSLQPHQEPRFLTPLLVPFVVLVANSGYLEAANKLFWVTWIVGNIVLSLLFGVLHQGAVVPSLLHINGLLSPDDYTSGSAIMYWKTYMPPRHLLGILQSDILSGHISVADFAGKSAGEAQDYFASLNRQHAEDTVVYLVTPKYAITSLAPHISSCFTINKRIYPHLDLDHIPESLGMGWPDVVSLNVYTADLGCLA